MNCDFVDNGSDSLTVGFISKSLGISFEKSLSLEERQSLVLKEVVDKNGRRVKRWCKPGTNQPPRDSVRKVKRVRGGRRYESPNESDRFRAFTAFSDRLNRNLKGTRTGLGTDVRYINYHHLSDHAVARKTYREDVMKSVRNILENPLAVRVGKNENGTTEYFGYKVGHEGDTRYAIVAVVLDNFEPSGVGKLQTIMTAETYKDGKQMSNGLNGSYKRVLDPDWKVHEETFEMDEKMQALKDKLGRKR